MDGLGDLDLGAIGGGVTLALALLQLLLRARLDLGATTLASLGVTVLLVPSLSALGAGLLAGAVVIAALAWWLAAARGVGRPELVGLVIAAVALTGLALPALPVDAATIRAAGAGATALAGVVGLLLARERKGLRGQRIYHWREVPVTPVDAPKREVG